MSPNEPAAAPTKRKPRILILEDDLATLDFLNDAFEEEKIEATTTRDPEAALGLTKTTRFDVILLDMGLPKMHGTEFLKRLREHDTAVQVVVVSGQRDPESAKTARSLGVWSYLSKPINMRGLMAAVRGALITKATKNASKQDDVVPDSAFAPESVEEPEAATAPTAITGTVPRAATAPAAVDAPSPARADAHRADLYLGTPVHSPIMQQLIAKALRVAPHFSCVMITGATGSGKSALAQAMIDGLGIPASQVTRINCRTAGREDLLALLEQERREGPRTMRGGVAVLDHLNGLDPESQDLLMDWLESRESAPPGRGARVIAIGSPRLGDLVEEGKFSEGLYYRLSRVELDVPDLARRRKDILVLARAFLARIPSPVEPAKRELSMRTSACFLSYPWPGNVQELMGAVESGLWATQSGTVEIEDLPQRLIAHYEEHKADIQRDVINVIKGAPSPAK